MRSLVTATEGRDAASTARDYERIRSLGVEAMTAASIRPEGDG